MRAVILDSFALREGDIDWSALRALVDVTASYPRTAPAEVAARLQGAQIAVVNKAFIGEEVLRACPELAFVCVTATGTDSLDIAACRRHGVPVANVPGYATESVAQHTLALMLSLCGCPGRWDASVRAGHWQLDVPQDGSVFAEDELCGKTLGLVGYGTIARRVAVLAQAFGMRVACSTRTVREAWADDGVSFVSLDALMAMSDVISLHCPATPATVNLLNARTLSLCRPGVRIVNTARGALVDEPALIAALQSGQAAGFAADVCAHEPVPADSPLLRAPHVLLTPHIAWASPQALARLAHIVAADVASYLEGGSLNVVN